MRRGSLHTEGEGAVIAARGARAGAIAVALAIAALIALAACSSRGAAPVPPTTIATIAPPPPPAAAPPRPPAPPRPDDRVPAVAPTDVDYRLQEHPDLANGCARDADCLVGGCAGYACTADPDVDDVCLDTPALPPIAATCGCVAGACVWWRRRDFAGPGASGQACVDARCIHDDLACVADRCTPKGAPR